MQSTMSALSIPTVVWSGIVAAAISLGGVILSNSSTARRLKFQLNHDANEKVKDRLGVLRKEVYLPLYSDMMGMSGHLGALSEKDPTKPEFSAPVQAAITQLAKAQLVGGSDVMMHASELQALYAESLFSLIVAAKPLHELRTDIEISNQFYNQNLNETQRVINELTALNESGKPDPTKRAALQRSCELFQSQTKKYADERSGAWDKYTSSQGGFVEAVKKTTARIAPYQVKLMAAIKNEIGVLTDESAMLARLEQDQLRMERALKEVMAQIAPSESE